MDSPAQRCLLGVQGANPLATLVIDKASRPEAGPSQELGDGSTPTPQLGGPLTGCAMQSPDPGSMGRGLWVWHRQGWLSLVLAAGDSAGRGQECWEHSPSEPATHRWVLGGVQARTGAPGRGGHLAAVPGPAPLPPTWSWSSPPSARPQQHRSGRVWALLGLGVGWGGVAAPVPVVVA